MVQRRHLALVAAALATAGAGARPARAQDTVPIDEHTAYMVGAHRLKLGLLSFEYGIIGALSVGTDAPFWVSGAVSPIFAPNLHVKAAFVSRPGFQLSGLLAGYYVKLNTGEVGPADLVTIPATLLASFDLPWRFRAHLEANYNWVRATKSKNLSEGAVAGALALRSGQVGVMFDRRMTRVLWLMARARWQFASSPLRIDADGVIDPYSTVHLAAELRPEHPHPAMAVAGVALSW
jgi:hypothetical protein